MEFLDLLAEIWGNYTFRNVILGAGLLGLVSGFLSVFTVLRGESLLSEALSHSVLPGIGMAFLIMGIKDPLALTLGALIFGVLATMSISGILRYSDTPKDAAMAVVLSSFYGLGIVILTFIARGGNSEQSGLEGYLLGEAATLLEKDVWLIGILSLVVFVILGIFYKELKLFIFDAEMASHLGFSLKKLQIILLSLIVLVVILGLKLVGTVLMAALLIGPAIVARFWSSRFLGVVIISCVVGIFSGISGAFLSISDLALPTGPMVVLVLFGLLGGAIIFKITSPNLSWRERNK